MFVVMVVVPRGAVALVRLDELPAELLKLILGNLEFFLQLEYSPFLRCYRTDEVGRVGR